MSAGTTKDTRTPEGPPDLRQPRPDRRGWGVALLVAAVVTALAAVALPQPPDTPTGGTGDQTLVEELRVAADGVPAQGFAAATGGGGDPLREAAIGLADARDDSARPLTAATAQEVGSVTKSMTGLLLADAVTRGEVGPTTTLAEVFTDTDLPVDLGGRTLHQLATHTSGLPSLGDGRTVRALLTNYTHGNPYADQTVDDVLAEAAGTRRLGEPGEYRYSNLGFSLLGHALAARAGTTWPELLQQRLLDPLGTTSTVVGRAPDGAAHETAANGAPVQPWTSVGTAPAGAGVWSSAQDLGRLLDAVAAGTAPGPDALTPREDTDQGTVRTGWGWFTLERDGRQVLFNNGATGGGVSSIVLDPASGEWVAVTAPSSTRSQTVAFALAGIEVAPDGLRERWTSPPVLATAVLVLLALLGPVGTALQRRVRTPGQRLDRLRVLDGNVVPSLVLLVALHRVGAWDVVPAVVWLLTVFLAALACASMLVRWPRLRWPQRHRAARWTGAAISTGLFLTALLVLVGGVV